MLFKYSTKKNHIYITNKRKNWKKKTPRFPLEEVKVKVPQVIIVCIDCLTSINSGDWNARMENIKEKTEKRTPFLLREKKSRLYISYTHYKKDSIFFGKVRTKKKGKRK